MQVKQEQARRGQDTRIHGIIICKPAETTFNRAYPHVQQMDFFLMLNIDSIVLENIMIARLLATNPVVTMPMRLRDDRCGASRVAHLQFQRLPDHSFVVGLCKFSPRSIGIIGAFGVVKTQHPSVQSPRFLLGGISDSKGSNLQRTRHRRRSGMEPKGVVVSVWQQQGRRDGSIQRTRQRRRSGMEPKRAAVSVWQQQSRRQLLC